MVGASKILTVSYGTFSCTLEGFDEPFSTMKSIAEYFRDLAADDRYFGAEPPTPDAEMLHRIAEREVQRRVEARVGDDGIVLRQMEHAETAEPAAAPAPTPAKVPVAATLADLAPAPQADEAQAELDAEPEAETDAPATYQAQEDIAPEADFSAAGFEPSEDLQETEVAAAAEDGATEEPSLEAGAETEAAEPRPYVETYEEVSEVYEETYEEVAEAYPADEPAADVAAEPEYQPEPAGEAYQDEEQDYADTAADAAAAEPAPVEDDNSVAAKLSRIRAVVGAAAAETADEADEADQPVAEAANIDASFAEAFEDLDAEDGEDALSGEPVAEEAELTEFGESSEADLAALDGEMPHETYASQEEETAKDVAAGLSPADENEDETSALDLSAYIAEPGEDAQNEVEPEIVEVQSAYEDEPEDEAHGAEVSADQEAPKAVLEAGVDSSLSDEDEAELVALLNKAEAARQESEIAAEEPVQDEAPIEEAAEDDHAEAEEAADTTKSGDSSFDRILEETNSKLDDTEGTRRRSAIAHLKAAVAATKAERLLGRNRKDEEEAEEQSQYRDDLAKVVRPRREFEKSEASSARPAPLGEKPSPLVLVSEQRVDQAEAEKAPQPSNGSVLPRRVSMAASAAEDEEADENGMDSYADVDTSFAEFAEEMGAVELPDLLEAAAAYSAFVEGNKHFSRPQLMRKVASYEKTEEYTREAGLRSFGQLLRQGKIQKLRRGQFTIREDTRFNPEARLAGE